MMNTSVANQKGCLQIILEKVGTLLVSGPPASSAIVFLFSPFFLLESGGWGGPIIPPQGLGIFGILGSCRSSSCGIPGPV